MNVSELSGAQLDYWVARALGDRMARIVGAEEHERCETRFGEQWPWSFYKPSGAWMDGGPIIEREKIILSARQRLDDGRWTHLHWHARAYMPANSVRRLIDYGDPYQGDTALVAAMRAYVASKYGDGVPDAD
jgi:hypothetical protein